MNLEKNFHLSDDDLIKRFNNLSTNIRKKIFIWNNNEYLYEENA